MIEFSYELSKVVILPEHLPFFKSVPKKDLQEVITYLYYFYLEDKLADVPPEERKKIILDGYVSKINLEAHSEIISKFESVTLSSTQKLAMAHLKKIESIIKLFYDSPITSLEQLETQAKLMASIDKLYVISDKLNAILAKEGKGTKGKGSKKISEAEEENFDDV